MISETSSLKPSSLSDFTTLVYVMVGKIVEDGESAVKLLGEDDAYHLVGEGHLRKGNLSLGKGVNLGGEAIGASYNKDKATAHGIHSLL